MDKNKEIKSQTDKADRLEPPKKERVTELNHAEPYQSPLPDKYIDKAESDLANILGEDNAEESEENEKSNKLPPVSPEYMLLNRFLEFKNKVDFHRGKKRGLKSLRNNYLSIFKTLSMNREIFESIKEGTKMEVDDYGRWKFSVEKDGKSVRYLASWNAVFRIDKELADKKDQTWEYTLYDEELGTKVIEKGSIQKKDITREHYDKNGDHMQEMHLALNGKKFYSKDKKEALTFYDLDTTENDPIYKRYPDGNMVMFDADGTEFGNFQFEKKKAPEMTDNQYLDMLAQKLNTPEKLHIFFSILVQYLHDDPKKADAKFTTPNIGGRRDYWQTATETINRIEYSKMLGDCDDYAFLAKEILNRQSPSKNAHVLLVPSHATCIWVEKNNDGRYDAYSMGTYGLDINGNRHGMTPDENKAKGYDNLQDAINSLMKKYETVDLGLEKGQNHKIHAEVQIADIPSKGRTEINFVPLEVFIDPKLYDQIMAVTKINLDRPETSYKKQEEILLDIINNHPNNPRFNKKLAEVYANLNMPDKQIEQLEMAIKNGEKDDYTISTLLQLYENSDLDKAILLIDTLDYSAYSSYLAELHIKNGDTKSAIDTLSKSIIKDPSNGSSYDKLIEIYASEGNISKINDVVKLARKNLSLSTSLGMSHTFYLAKTLHKNNLNDLASTVFDRLFGNVNKLSKKVRIGDYQYSEYCKFLIDTGDIPKAAKILNDGLKKFPDSLLLLGIYNEHEELRK